jgi:nucleoside-triphosphatase
LLLEGRPGIGKTTVARRLVELLEREGVRVRGFITEEIRERGRRVGFAVQTLAGAAGQTGRGVLAHADLPGPPRVGKYGVDISAFERLVLPGLTRADPGDVVVIDELGKMELASARFRRAVTALFDTEARIVATVHLYGHPFTDALKARPDVEVLRVTRSNRDELAQQLLERLKAP